MFLMSTSMVLCEHFVSFHPNTLPSNYNKTSTSTIATSLCPRNHRLCGLIANAENSHRRGRRKRPWWKKFFFDDDGNWLGLRDDDMSMSMSDDSDTEGEEEVSEEEKFEAWRRRAEAISELREAQEDTANAENRKWEDWLVEGDPQVNNSSRGQDWADGLDGSVDDTWTNPTEIMSADEVVDSISALVIGKDKDEFTYEDRVFQYASTNSAKFLAILVIIPWTLDFVVHDFVLMPFLDRYVKTVPLAAEFFDVRRSQKLEMINALKVEKARFRFEVEIGKSPPLSDEEAWLELRHKALELRDEWRLENRRAFANILSDMLFGVVLFLLLYFNESNVALLKFTGYKLLNNVSDTGKAFLIILTTDIFLGYHSESGWQTLVEVIFEHYGFEVDEAAITIFICLVPVMLDACVKLWRRATSFMRHPYIVGVWAASYSNICLDYLQE